MFAARKKLSWFALLYALCAQSDECTFAAFQRDTFKNRLCYTSGLCSETVRKQLMEARLRGVPIDDLRVLFLVRETRVLRDSGKEVNPNPNNDALFPRGLPRNSFWLHHVVIMDSAGNIYDQDVSRDPVPAQHYFDLLFPQPYTEDPYFEGVDRHQYIYLREIEPRSYLWRAAVGPNAGYVPNYYRRSGSATESIVRLSDFLKSLSRDAK
ncbi:MAG: hypothetical protein HYR96_02315 [Deltaproteobacteria bacterium]|nr:hypothetical protein [Deltaproteobacteria bacterium]MBI3293142.1 hypothetical protein [Deltaproteobacteria bacterium]